MASDDISITGGPVDQQVTVDSGGRPVATAAVDSTGGPEVVRVALRGVVEPLPRPAGARLVDAVLDLPAVAGANRVEASIPTADADMVLRVRERVEEVETRLAGSTVLVVAHPGAGAAPGAGGDSPPPVAGDAG